jgi:hypothetical protein
MNFLHMDKKVGAKIIYTQNMDDMLKCLAAQRYLYSSAKKIFSWQLIFSTIGIIILTLINYYKNISWIIASCGFLITIIDVIWLSPSIKKRKEKAAKIQELFDITVLNIKWNDILVGEKPTDEEIYRYSEKYKRKYKDFSSLKNWYSPKIANINSDAAKIICQRSNSTYDYTVRKSFSNFILIILVITLLIVIFFGLIEGLTFRKFFIILSSISPAIFLLYKTISENNLAKRDLDELRSKIESLWNELLSNKKIDIDFKAREIQDKIFLNRKSSPLIFDWFYNLKRNQLESEMNFSIEKLIEEYKKRVNHA